MKRFLSVLLGMAMLMTMALALAGCNKNPDTAAKRASEPTVTAQTVKADQQTVKTADTVKKEAQKSDAKNTQKANTNAVQNTNLKASQNKTQSAVQNKSESAAQKAAQPAATTAPQNKTQQAEQKAVKPVEQDKAQQTIQPSAQPVEQKEEQSEAQMSTQSVKTESAIQRFEGTYACDRCTIEVKETVANTVVFHVYWSSSAWERSEWIMTGNLSEDGTSVTYGDCMRRNNAYNDNGAVTACDLVYYGGKGTITFQDNTLVWEDLAENIAAGMTFTKVA